MTSQPLTWLYATLAGLLLGACSQPVPPADRVPVPAPVQADASLPEVGKGVRFSVEPAHVHACAGRDRTSAVVRWDVRRPGVNTVKVLVSDRVDTRRKVLAEMPPQGEATTGDWVTEGLLVELVDANGGAVLAAHAVQALPCN